MLVIGCVCELLLLNNFILSAFAFLGLEGD